MRAFVGVTDASWHAHLLTTGPQHTEVNFWWPGSQMGFAQIAIGEPFIFKSHIDRSGRTPSNRIVGVGVFSGYARATISEAWDLYRDKNGVPTLAALRERIAHYLRRDLSRFEDPVIGCAMLRDVVMFGPGEQLAAPVDFPLSQPRGRAYDLANLDTSHSVVEALVLHQIASSDDVIELGTTRGTPIEVVPRVGQQAFKLLIAEKYGHHCAITGEKVRPVLEAAHILPVADGGQHRVDNGLLLRSDIHTLFDRGYIGVDLKYRLRVSPALRDEFGNGDWFYSREGESITTPGRRSDRPHREFLEWHNDVVFRAG